MKLTRRGLLRRMLAVPAACVGAVAVAVAAKETDCRAFFRAYRQWWGRNRHLLMRQVMRPYPTSRLLVIIPKPLSPYEPSEAATGLVCVPSRSLRRGEYGWAFVGAKQPGELT